MESDKKYIDTKSIIETWASIVRKGLIDRLPHINRIISRACHLKITEDLTVLRNALVEISEINETYEELGFYDSCDDSGCKTCHRRRCVGRSLKRHISRINQVLSTQIKNE